MAVVTALFSAAVGCHSANGSAANGPVAREPGTNSLRIMTWNIHHGRGMDRRIDLERIAELIRQVAPDIVALQEVDMGTERVAGRELAAELARMCGMDYRFGKNIDFMGGGYGNATLSRLPFESASNHHFTMLRRGEQRGVLSTIFELGGTRVVVRNTHLDYSPDPAERLSNVAELLEFAGSEPALDIVCGDLNARPQGPALNAIRVEFEDAWRGEGGAGDSYPSDAPRKRIDYVLFERGRGVEVQDCRTAMTDASDHLPVIVDLVVPHSGL